jgi:hypothetical protein
VSALLTSFLSITLDLAQLTGIAGLGHSFGGLRLHWMCWRIDVVARELGFEGGG